MKHFLCLLAITMLFQTTLQQTQKVFMVDNYTNNHSHLSLEQPLKICQYFGFNNMNWNVDHQLLEQNLGPGYYDKRFNVRYQTVYDSFIKEEGIPQDQTMLWDSNKGEYAEQFLYNTINMYKLYFNPKQNVVEKNGIFEFDVVAESTDGLYKIIHRAETNVSVNVLESDKFNFQYQNGYANKKDNLNLEFENPCAYFDNNTIIKLNIDYYPYRFTYNQVIPFADINGPCMIKLNGVQKQVQCTKISEKEIHLSDVFPQDFQSKKVKIQLEGVYVHPITTLVTARLYQGQVDQQYELILMNQYNLNTKLPLPLYNTTQIDFNSPAAANVSSTVYTDVSVGIEYGAITFNVNAEILRLASSFTVKITDLVTNKYSYGTVALNTLGEGTLTRVYPFDLKNKVKFEFSFPFTQNQAKLPLRVYANILESRSFLAFRNDPIFFEFSQYSTTGSTGFSHLFSNLHVGGKNRLTFSINQSIHNINSSQGKIVVDPQDLGKFDEKNLTEVWIDGVNKMDSIQILADGSVEIGPFQVPQHNFDVELAFLKNSVYFTGPSMLSFQLFDGQNLMINKDVQAQLVKKNFVLNYLNKTHNGNEIILDIGFSYDEIIDFEHYFRVQMSNGVVKSGDSCISSASFSFNSNTICENVNDSVLKIKDLLYSARVGAVNNLRLKVLNPNGATNTDVTIDIFPDTAEIADIQDPASEHQISVSATGNVAL